EDNKEEFVWATSWGISTRLIGGVILAHGDKKGLRIPPNIAPIQVVLIPIFRDAQQKQEVEQYIHSIINNLDNIGVRYFVDWSDSSPGYKFNEWEMKGIPVRMEIGPRDVESNKVVFARRDNGEKYTISCDELSEKINTLLIEIQSNLLNQAKSFRDNNTHTVQSYKEFKDIIESGGFIRCGWDGSEETESKIKEETKATIRCIPFDENPKNLNCIYSGVPAKHEVIYAKAY
ncbi:MAG: His/Gly/Thr/Pro-type tRNA ligase C-terminal domain-containing protein, partial [Candidatus Neomarinimicrobiota bacterium]|nr:His/Gly/Thr/Pro-type tRNA ligase C-terminal domain-containing protein [Candidatus Neomarinimicrobiota bacterium]